jgi:hypothetical protein
VKVLLTPDSNGYGTLGLAPVIGCCLTCWAAISQSSIGTMYEDVIHTLATSRIPGLGQLKRFPEISSRSEEDGWKT